MRPSELAARLRAVATLFPDDHMVCHVAADHIDAMDRAMASIGAELDQLGAHLRDLFE